MTKERILLLVLSVTYIVFLAWYDGWWMSPLTQSEVDAYLVNLRDDSEFGEMGGLILKNFDQVFETLQFQQDSSFRDGKTDLGKEVQENLSMIEAGLKEGDEITFQELALSPDEKERFQVLGPITQKEIEETDWDQLSDDLTS